MTISSALTCAAIGALMVLCCDPARAEGWEAPNKAGGKIVLTTRARLVPGAEALFEAYTFSSAGRPQISKHYRLLSHELLQFVV